MSFKKAIDISVGRNTSCAETSTVRVQNSLKLEIDRLFHLRMYSLHSKIKERRPKAFVLHVLCCFQKVLTELRIELLASSCLSLIHFSKFSSPHPGRSTM